MEGVAGKDPKNRLIEKFGSVWLVNFKEVLIMVLIIFVLILFFMILHTQNYQLKQKDFFIIWIQLPVPFSFSTFFMSYA